MAERKMTEEEFAARVGRPAKTIGNWRRLGLVDYHREGRLVYYLEEDVELWHQRRKREAWALQESKLRKAG